MPQCLLIIDFNAEISANKEFTLNNDLSVAIAAYNYYTGLTDLKAEISVTVPFVDLKTAISAGFPDDDSGPYVVPETYPLNNEGGIGVYGPIFIIVEDLISGIDLSSLKLTVNSVVYTQADSEVTCLPITAPYRYAIRFVPSTAWSLNSTVTVSVFIKDRTGNPGMTNLTL